MPHLPVLLKEVIEFLNPQPGEFFIDGTLGSGGHAIEIIKRISPGGIFLGIDWDKETLERTRLNLETQSLTRGNKIILVNENYADLPKILKKNNLPRADGLLLDLGFSSEQLENSGRGFSFLRDEPLDMRYNKNFESNLTAEGVVNKFSEKELVDIFGKYGEEKFSHRIAKKIIEERKKKSIRTALELVTAIKKAVPPNYEKGRLHPATRVFQALRIYINKELENLERLLKNLLQIVRGSDFGLSESHCQGKFKTRQISPEARYSDALYSDGRFRVAEGRRPEARYSDAKGGRVAIISYHSLEDRLVKNYFRNLKKQGKAEILTKKPVRPKIEEIQNNPRSRSAKMRVIIMK